MIYYNQIEYFLYHKSMVEAKKQSTKPRAKLAHKLAKYVRAVPLHLLSKSSAQEPSVSHLLLGGGPRRKLRNNSKTWYPADDEKVSFKRKRNQPKPSQGRKSVQPGNVVIILSGKDKGRRVVVLKSLASGNLLVSGPFSVNGVPLKRVNPAYVIATSSKVSLDGVKVDVDDSFFKKFTSFNKFELKNASEAKLKKVESGNQSAEEWKKQAKVVQKTIDAKLLQNIKKIAQMKEYLGTRFTLFNNSKPHEMKF